MLFMEYDILTHNLQRPLNRYQTGKGKRHLYINLELACFSENSSSSHLVLNWFSILRDVNKDSLIDYAASTNGLQYLDRVSCGYRGFQCIMYSCNSFQKRFK